MVIAEKGKIVMADGGIIWSLDVREANRVCV